MYTKLGTEFARYLVSKFAETEFGKQMLEQIENDWKPVIQVFEAFASTVLGKAVAGLGGAAYLALPPAIHAATAEAPTGAPTLPPEATLFSIGFKWDFPGGPKDFELKLPHDITLPPSVSPPQKPQGQLRLHMPPIRWRESRDLLTERLQQGATEQRLLWYLQHYNDPIQRALEDSLRRFRRRGTGATV